MFSGFVTSERCMIICLVVLNTVKVIWSISVIVGLKLLLCDLMKIQIVDFGFSRPLLVTLLPPLIKCRLFDVCYCSKSDINTYTMSSRL